MPQKGNIKRFSVVEFFMPAAAAAEETYTLVYFPVRGRAEAIRLCMELKGVSYKEIPMNDRAEMKANAGMEYPFGQVPILKKDGRVMAQSGAILRYLGRRHGMYDGSPEELEAIDEMIAGVDDLRAQYHPLVYVHRLAPDYLKEYIAKHIDPKGIHEDNKGAHMAFLNKLFEKHFARYDDSSLNIGHVKLFDVVDTHLRGALNPSSQFQEWYPELVKFHAYFADLPMIRTYLGSERRHVDINANKLG